MTVRRGRPKAGTVRDRVCQCMKRDGCRQVLAQGVCALSFLIILSVFVCSVPRVEAGPDISWRARERFDSVPAEASTSDAHPSNASVVLAANASDDHQTSVWSGMKPSEAGDRELPIRLRLLTGWR